MCIYCEGAREDATDETAATESNEDEHAQNTSAAANAVQQLKQWIAH